VISIKNPEQIYRGTDFWMLNDRLSEEEIRKQIKKMHEQGVASFIARTYIGLKSDYPGEDFMAKTALIISEAKKYGMTVFLQAGYMPEAVLDLPERFAMDYLSVFDAGAVPEEERVLSVIGGKAYTSRNSVTLLNLFDKEAIDFYVHQSYDLWQRFSDEFGKTVLSVWVDEPSYHQTHLPWSDCIDKAFTEKYGYDIKPYLNELYENTGTYKTTRYRYWTLLQKMMEEAYFAKIRAWCNENNLWFSGHLMFEDCLFDQILRACATMPYYKYFDIPGIDSLCGRMEWNNNPITRDSNKHFDTTMYTTPMQCVSAAHQAGKEHILCEMYGVTTNGMGFRDLEHYFDHFASMGINHRSTHGIFYSLHGRGKRQYPPHVNYYQPYWHKYKIVTDYCARVSRFLSQGKPNADTLVIHPIETAYCLFRGGFLQGHAPEDMASFDLFFNELTRTLLSAHIGYEFGDLNTISSGYAKVGNGAFCVGKMAYRTVVLPKLSVLDKKTAELISEFSAQGGKVIVLGEYPEMLDGEACDVKNTYLGQAEFASDIGVLVEKLENARGYTLETDLSDGAIRVYRTEKDGEQFVMLFNGDCKSARKCRFTVPGNMDASLFDAHTGESNMLSTAYDGTETVIYIKVEEGGSCLLHLTKSTKSIRLATAREQAKQILPLPIAFSVKREQENVCLLEFCSYRTEDMTEFEGPFPVLAVNRILTDADYHGELIQRFSFRADRVFHGLSLALEDAERCEVFLNGEKAEDYDGESIYYAKAFCKVPLPDTCIAGENIIEIRRRFEPLSRAKSAITSLFECQLGVELESMYLLGDFGVYSVSEPTANGLMRYNRNSILSEEKQEVIGELTKNGYMFYAGTLELSQKFPLSGCGGKAELSIPGFYGCVAEIIVNGISCGNIFRPPYSCDITKAVKAGENSLTILLTNTLRPILGPYHRPFGEIGECWGGYGDADLAWTNSGAGKDWYLSADVDSETWTSSYNQVKLGVLDARIEITK